MGIRVALQKDYEKEGLKVENADINIEELSHSQINTNQIQKQVIL
ncbi:hypothetical protein A1E_02430 [Rickettsia canadensis str. McKiel]|uniref:Uncharacterized protein n=1 Tax=Rickettsia canadensis (strain McKiel) TaxID=293613 RepID=A8EYJ8_RICCK|nr:hypothetical protein A1E_02430 [Rickettsia canadensis str. McKiel]